MKSTIIIMVLVLAGAAWSFSVQPDYGGVQDTGFDKLPGLNVRISIDCDTNALAVTVKGNDTNQPIEDASVYLFYTNYGYSQLANGKTNSDGVAAIPITGKRDFLTSMFILRTDATGHRSREIEFTYKKCLEAPPAEKPKPPANQTAPPVQNVTNSSQNTTKNASENSTTPIVSNVTVKDNSTGNQTAAPPAPQKPSGGCLPAYLAPLFAYFVISRK